MLLLILILSSFIQIFPTDAYGSCQCILTNFLTNEVTCYLHRNNDSCLTKKWLEFTNDTKLQFLPSPREINVLKLSGKTCGNFSLKSSDLKASNLRLNALYIENFQTLYLSEKSLSTQKRLEKLHFINIYRLFTTNLATIGNVFAHLSSLSKLEFNKVNLFDIKVSHGYRKSIVLPQNTFQKLTSLSEIIFSDVNFFHSSGPDLLFRIHPSISYFDFQLINSFSLHPEVRWSDIKVVVRNQDKASVPVNLTLISNHTRTFIFDKVNLHLSHIGTLLVKYFNGARVSAQSVLRSQSVQNVTIVNSNFNNQTLVDVGRMLSHVKNLSSVGIYFMFSLTGIVPTQFINLVCKNLNLTDVHYCGMVTTFTVGDILHCPQLEYLSLYGCALRTIPKSLFSHLGSLRTLVLDKNYFYGLPLHGLSLLTKLENFYFVNNHIVMPKNAFKFTNILRRLKYVDLSFTTITSSLENAFKDQVDLEYITLESSYSSSYAWSPPPQSEGTYIYQPWFQHNKKLRYINMKACKLFTPKTDASKLFDGLDSLTEINLEDTTFSQMNLTVQTNVIKSLENVTVLNLRQNGIENMSPLFGAAGNKYPNLKTLNLCVNRLCEVDKASLKNMPKLRQLLLKDNRVSNIQADVFNEMNNLTDLHLLYNSFVCICDILPFVRWLRNNDRLLDTNQKVLDHMRNQISQYADVMDYSNVVPLINCTIPWWECYNRKVIIPLTTSLILCACVITIYLICKRYKWRIWYRLIRTQVKWRSRLRLNQRDLSFYKHKAVVFFDEESHADADWVCHHDHFLKLELDLDIHIHIAPRDISQDIGGFMMDIIESTINKCEFVILVLSHGFLENQWALASAIQSEISCFQDKRGKVILLVKDEDVPINRNACLHRLYRLCSPHHLLHYNKLNPIDFWNRLGVILMSRKSQKLRVIQDLYQQSGSYDSTTRLLNEKSTAIQTADDE